jgi:hypothetical protein
MVVGVVFGCDVGSAGTTLLPSVFDVSSATGALGGACATAIPLALDLGASGSVHATTVAASASALAPAILCVLLIFVVIDSPFCAEPARLPVWVRRPKGKRVSSRDGHWIEESKSFHMWVLRDCPQLFRSLPARAGRGRPDTFRAASVSAATRRRVRGHSVAFTYGAHATVPLSSNTGSGLRSDRNLYGSNN